MRELPRAVRWVAGATLVNRIGAMVLPFLLLYLSRGLKLDLELAGQIAACWGLGSLLAGPLGGWAADRFDAVKLLAFALLGGGALMLAYPIFDEPLALAGMTFLSALLVDLSRPSSLTLLARLGGERSRDAFALNYLAINLGMSIGPTVGGFVVEYDYRWLFWLNGSSSAIAGVLLLLSGIQCPPVPRKESAADWNLGSAAFRMVALNTLILYVFLTFFNASPVFVVNELGMRERDCGLIWLINTVLIVLTTLWVNRITSHYKITLLLAGSAVGMAVGYAALVVSPTLGGLLMALLALTFSEILLFANANAYLSQSVRPEQIGKAMGLNSMAISLSVAASNPTVGYFFSQHRSQLLWVLLSTLGLVAAWGFYRLPELSLTGSGESTPESDSDETSTVTGFTPDRSSNTDAVG